jgi:cytochrome c biogenesis protein ResB
MIQARSAPLSAAWSASREHTIAAVLLALFTAVLLLGAVVPQRGNVAPVEYARWRAERAPVSVWLENAGLTSSSRSPWLPLVGAPLWALLAQCTTRRGLALARGWRRGRLTLAFVRQAGSVVFHGGLLFGLMSVALSAETRFVGRAELAPGAGVVDAAENYVMVESAPWSAGASGLTLRVDGLHLAQWPDGSLREHTAELSVLRNGSPIGVTTLTRGRPYDVQGTTVYLDSRAGPAVLLTASAAGRGVRSGWVHFPAWEPGDQADPTTVIAIPGSEVRFDARLANNELDLESRTAHVRIGEGETTHVEGFDLRLERVDAWTGLAVVRDPFASVAFGVFVLGLMGLSVAVLVPRRRHEKGS